ncbi:larB [Scenedesmus sp. PABB004]|nr:larB [Scenedesmus sp. PABB004]
MASLVTLRGRASVAQRLSGASGKLAGRPSRLPCRAVPERQQLEAALQATPSDVRASAPPRRGLPGVICSTARGAEDIAAEVTAALQACPQALVEGVEPDMYAALRKLVPGAKYHARAKMLIVKPPEPALPKQPRLPGTLCVVSAGPADQVAADRVKLAAEHMGAYVIAKPGLSTRDLPTLMQHAAALHAADVVVVVAGVDAALPGVVAGMVDVPVVALPTSAGGEPGLAGLGNLVAAASSAAPGVCIVGVDAAVSAATAAARTLRTAALRVERLAAAAAPPSPPAAPAPTPVAAPVYANNVVPRVLVDALAAQPAGRRARRRCSCSLRRTALPSALAMVRIIDGEIVADDDPRVQARAQPQRRPPAQQPPAQFAAARNGGAGPAPGGGAPVGRLDWSAPPLQLVPSAAGSSMLPDAVVVYGLRVPTMGLLAVAAAGLFFGWRGVLGGAIFGYLYLTYGAGGGVPAPPTHRRGAAGGQAGAAGGSGGGGGFADMFGGQAGAGAGSSGGDERGAHRPGSGGGGGGGGAAWQGKGRKLGSS